MRWRAWACPTWWQSAPTSASGPPPASACARPAGALRPRLHRRHQRSGATAVRFVFGRRRHGRAFVMTTDPVHLPAETTWHLVTNLPGNIEQTVGDTLRAAHLDRVRLQTRQGRAGLGRLPGHRRARHRALVGTGHVRLPAGQPAEPRLCRARRARGWPSDEVDAGEHAAWNPEGWTAMPVGSTCSPTCASSFSPSSVPASSALAPPHPRPRPRAGRADLCALMNTFHLAFLVIGGGSTAGTEECWNP